MTQGRAKKRTRVPRLTGGLEVADEFGEGLLLQVHKEVLRQLPFVKDDIGQELPAREDHMAVQDQGAQENNSVLRGGA
jgi:hypothetical protein